mmetsp:Transcript_3233/g.7554  ORF Transcript_3233/g.7554 Transcript_3233/m.7554 type:complete len:81 (-) Transcript_3233:327-569(-)
MVHPGHVADQSRIYCVGGNEKRAEVLDLASKKWIALQTCCKPALALGLHGNRLYVVGGIAGWITCVRRGGEVIMAHLKGQ